tara:strand:- start:1243 stop:1794 length:552 start_codon:yes stop_codon:yes gene_type:complete
MSSKFSSSFFKKSPLNVEVATGYVSTRESLQRMFDDISEGTAKAIEGAADPQIQADRLERRIERRNKRADKKGADGRIINEKTGEVISDLNPKRTKFDKKTGELEIRKKKAQEKADSDMTKKLKQYEEMYNVKNPSEVDFRLRLNEGQKIYNENKTTADKNWEDLSMAEKTQFVTQAKIYPIK